MRRLLLTTCYVDLLIELYPMVPLVAKDYALVSLPTFAWASLFTLTVAGALCHANNGPFTPIRRTLRYGDAIWDMTSLTPEALEEA